MIEYIEELYNCINTKEYDIRHLIALNVLIDHELINKDLRFLIWSLQVGDNEDIELNRQILLRTIENVLEKNFVR